ncbi:MAG: hypothetical protein IPJ04_01595 [Candidatus Eisenbacteria bacterium]|nr:hypothetical protein [Candidatus Eisenbacteria bacterium]
MTPAPPSMPPRTRHSLEGARRSSASSPASPAVGAAEVRSQVTDASSIGSASVVGGSMRFGQAQW